MALYETTLEIPRPVVETFTFVSDFSNAAKWDPRTYRAEKVTDGPIGVGTRFMLTGGILTEEWVRRLHVPERMAGMSLPYDVVEFDPPHGFVLTGENLTMRWRDHLEFTPGDGATHLRYSAELEFKGVLKVGEPMLRWAFRGIGDDATREMAAVVADLA